MPFFYGSLVHQAAEWRINDKNWMEPIEEAEQGLKKMMKEERGPYEESLTALTHTMAQYFDWFKSDPITYLAILPGDRRKAEFPFSVRLSEGITLKGKIDTVGKTKDKRKWLVEHKSTRELPEGSAEFKYADIQVVLYAWALWKQFKIRVDGVAWDYIRKKPMAVPEKLQDGSLSKRKNIDTTWPVYLAEIRRLNLNPRDYADMKGILQGREENFFRRVYLPLSGTELVDNIVNEAIMTAHEIDELKSEPTSHTRNLGWHCKSCPYNTLCMAELQGLDTDFMLKKDYKEVDDDDEDEKARRREE